MACLIVLVPSSFRFAAFVSLTLWGAGVSRFGWGKRDFLSGDPDEGAWRKGIGQG